MFSFLYTKNPFEKNISTKKIHIGTRLDSNNSKELYLSFKYNNNIFRNMTLSFLVSSNKTIELDICKHLNNCIIKINNYKRDSNTLNKKYTFYGITLNSIKENITNKIVVEKVKDNKILYFNCNYNNIINNTVNNNISINNNTLRNTLANLVTNLANSINNNLATRINTAKNNTLNKIALIKNTNVDSTIGIYKHHPFLKLTSTISGICSFISYHLSIGTIYGKIHPTERFFLGDIPGYKSRTIVPVNNKNRGGKSYIEYKIRMYIDNKYLWLKDNLGIFIHHSFTFNSRQPNILETIKNSILSTLLKDRPKSLAMSVGIGINYTLPKINNIRAKIELLFTQPLVKHKNNKRIEFGLDFELD